MRIAATPQPARKQEPTIALINVVFLMLIFFLIAGTLAPPLDKDLTLVSTAGLEGREPPDALVVRADGTTTWRGQEVSIGEAVVRLRGTEGEETDAIRIVPDRALPAAKLIGIANELRENGTKRVFIVTERGLE